MALHSRHAGPDAHDPRASLSSDALDEANRLAVPKVASGGGEASHLALGLAIAIGLGVFTFAQMNSARLKSAEPPPAPAIVEAPPQPVSSIPPRPEPQPITPQPEPLPEFDMIQPERLRAPGLVVDNSAFTEQPAAGAAASGTTASEQFAARARVAEEPPATATEVEDVSAVVLEGTILSGVLETAINSDLPGYVRAVVSDNVRSFDGTRVLVPRGSRLIGQYRSGLAIGESRAFVIWTRLVLPDGASIRIASPATDTLGRAGLSGSVDRHFLQRFGSAILLSVVGAGLDLAAASAGGSNQVIVGTTSDAYAIAQAALQSSMNIPPTVKVPQGSPIRIFVARDLYFPDRAAEPFRQSEASP